jgi:hypothetical protein
LIGGAERSPPSKTNISESMSLVDNLKWFDGTMTSRRMFVIFRFFFCARRDLRWRTFGDNTFRCVPAAASYRVRREVVELDLEKTCTKGWEWGGGKADADSTSCSSPQVSIVWQLKAYETVLDWVKALQWTLSLLTSSGGGTIHWSLEDCIIEVIFLMSFRQPCSEMWRKENNISWWVRANGFDNQYNKKY